MKDFSLYTKGRAGGFLLPGAEAHYPPDLLLEPTHLDATFRIDIDHATLRGEVTLLIEANADGADRLSLHAVAFEDLEVEGAEWTYSGEAIDLRWSEPFARDEAREVTVRYRITEPGSGLYFSKPSEAYPNAATYAATDSETERARHWLPTIDLPTVRPTLKMTLIVPKGYEALANGYLVSDTVDGELRTTVWQLDQPIPSYLTCFAVGDLVRCDDGEYNGRPLAYFAPPPHTVENLHRSFGDTGEMMAWMEKRLGVSFPYPKYYQFALPDFGGAMENISLVSWNEVFVADAPSYAEWGWLIRAVNLHEMSHSYFGDMVVCRDFASAWLKESWAVFMEQVWWEETTSKDRGQLDFLMNARAYFDEADNRYVRPIMTREYNTSWQMYDRHLYPGGACRIHTLREELGHEVFWAGVTDYLETYRDKVVETDHFRHKMEAHSGRSLGRFFDQWIHSKGYPKLKVSFSHDAKQGQGRFTVEQTQVDKKKEIGLFTLSVALGWTDSEGEHTRPIRLDKAKHEFTVPMAEAPKMVRFDPETRALYKLEFNPGDPLLRTQVTDAPDVIGRILAGETLIETGKRGNIDVVLKAYADEPFWGVRTFWGTALAKKANVPALKALAEVIATEQDPQVLWLMLRDVVGTRDAGVAAAVRGRIAKGDLTPRVLGLMYQILGVQRDEADLAQLQEAGQTEGFLGFAQGGALRGVGSIATVEARDYLIAQSKPGATPNTARTSAVTGLGAMARRLPKHERLPIQDHLLTLLRDENPRIPTFARQALVAMGARGAAGAIEASASELSAQERHDVNVLLKRLRAQGDPKVASLEEEVEKLRKRVATLEAAADTSPSS